MRWQMEQLVGGKYYLWLNTSTSNDKLAPSDWSQQYLQTGLHIVKHRPPPRGASGPSMREGITSMAFCPGPAPIPGRVRPKVQTTLVSSLVSSILPLGLSMPLAALIWLHMSGERTDSRR